MIKYKMQVDKKMVVGLGLTDGNIEKLRADQPIMIDGQELGLAHDILIFWGPTEMQIYKQFKKAGLITKETKLNLSRDLD